MISSARCLFSATARNPKLNDEKDRFLLFHIRREQYANRPL